MATKLGGVIFEKETYSMHMNGINMIFAALAVFLVSLMTSFDASAEDRLKIFKNQAATKTNWILFLEGRISDGDAERVKQFIERQGYWPSTFFLINMPGGEVDEALEIANLIDSSLSSVDVSGYCASACVYLVMGANRRSLFELFEPVVFKIHRPYFHSGNFSQLDRSAAEREYARLEGRVREFLRSRLMPESLIDEMFSVPSTQAKSISGEAMLDMIGDHHRPFGEWLIAKCEHLSLTEVEQTIYQQLFNDYINLGGSLEPERQMLFDSLEQKSGKHRHCEQQAILVDQLKAFDEFSAQRLRDSPALP